MNSMNFNEIVQILIIWKVWFDIHVLRFDFLIDVSIRVIDFEWKITKRKAKFKTH